MSPVAAVPGPAAVTDTNPTPEVTSAPVNEPSFVAPAPVEPAVNATPASAVQAEPENYFQPSSLDITQNNPAPVVESPTQPLQGEATTPAPNPTEASNFFDQSEPVTPAVDPLATAPTPDPSYSATPTEPAREIFETPTSSLDDLLSQYSGGTAPVAPAPAPTPTPNPIYPGPQTTGDVADPYPSTPTSPQPVSVPQNPPTMPGANNIPDPASVFGPGTTPMPPVKRPLNKWWVIGGASAAVLLLAGLVFLGISLFKPKESTDPNVVREEETLKYSELVGKAMDPNQNMVTTFDQTLDFSGTEVKASDQNGELMKLLFAEPVAAKGNWQSDQAGNISLDGSFANVASKRIYIDGEKGTYVFSNEAGTWNKSDGYQFGIIPPFFSPENKGGLFYVSKNDEITYLNDEELDGNTYKKIKLFPKKEIFQSFISGSNALLANLKYEEVTTDNIEVFAWIEESGKIHKVSVQGDLGIKSDLFDGTVKVSSTAGYEYKEVKITKP
jgi:hypothetical protein